MKNNIKILKFFTENKDSSFTIKKVSEILKINYRIAYEEIIKLNKEKLIKIKKYGNSNICSFDYVYNSKSIKVEELRKEELFKNKDIKLIFKRFQEIKIPFYCLLVFGSYANKSHNKHSDIDLCIICNDKRINKKISLILGITPINIHLQEFTSKQFIEMINSKKDNIGNGIMKNNIILYGAEAFYEMVN